MKTAMEELIYLMKTHQKRGWGSMTYDFFFAQIEEINALKKEKEQIINLIRFLRTNDKMGKSVDDLYNEFYNQNK